MPLRLLYQDEHLVAVDKPAGFHVHPPEDLARNIRPSVNCLAIVRDQLGKYLYPVHRLDVPTSGVLLFALDPETARRVAGKFRGREMEKTYYCVARGWVGGGAGAAEDSAEFTIDRPLGSEADPAVKLPSETVFNPIARIELPHAVGPRYPTARYTLLRAEPRTGRFHQIRRHLSGASHPIVGDAVYGDGAHNRFFRGTLELRGLLLKAQVLRFEHPHTGEPIRIESKWSGQWHRLFEMFGVCPF